MLDVNNLSICFVEKPEEEVVKNVSFTVGSGETVALVGESGSGKSLTAMSIPRLLPEGAKIVKGSISLGQENIFRLSNNEMTKLRGSSIGMIFQEAQSSLNPVITIGQQIAEAIEGRRARVGGIIKEKVLALMKDVGIDDADSRIMNYPHQFSGGMKQRVMIAMALARSPSLLIADEPTTALDVTIQAQILSLIKSLQRRDAMGVLFITHDLAVAYEVADRILVMRKGEIVESGDVQLLRLGPKHEYSKQLLDSLPSRKKRIGELRESGSVENEKIIQVKGLKVWFPIKKGLLKRTVGYVKAVDGVDLELKKGRTLALVGESGSGKTTIGKGITHLVDIMAGEILFKGRNLQHYGGQELRSVRSELQIIFQDPYSSLNPRMRVGDIIREGMEVQRIGENRREQDKKVFELLKLVGLKNEHYRRYPHEFSGGQRQRICIARALAVNPDVIVCDEPTSSLDVSIQYQVLSLLLKLQKDHALSYLFVTHDIGVVAYIADDVAVMKGGRIVEQGPVAQILENPRNDYTRKLLNSVPRIPERHEDYRDSKTLV